jgi:hypothetical protein
MYKKIQDLISQALKAGDTRKLNTLRLIKSEFLLAEKNKVEITDSIEQYKKANRFDLVQKEEEEIAIIKQYLPEQPNEEFLKNYIRKCIDGYKESADSIISNGTTYSLSMKDMKPIMNIVKEKYDFPIVGKLVSIVLKEYV